MSLPAHGTVISRLRLRAASADALAARLRLSSALSVAELAPAGLPSTAIVCIRRLGDPLPGRWRLEHAGHRPPLAWQQAVGQRIDALARRAARPACGFVPDAAEAVLFMDRSELLACLARDWCHDVVAARWWWRSLLRDPDIARAVLDGWLHGPEYVPAALQQLADSHHAIDFVRRLEPAAANALLAGLLDVFGLAELRGSIAEAVAWRATPTTAGEHHASQAGDRARAATAALPSASGPFVRWVPEAGAAGLVRGQRMLLAVGLMLQRAPAVVRSQAFTRQMARWVATPSDAPPAPAVPAVSSRAGRRSAPGRAHLNHGEKFARTKSRSLPPQSDPRHAVPVSVPVASAMPARHSAPTSADATVPANHLPSPDEPAAARAAGQLAAREPATSPDEYWIDTAQGGALFLINLGLYLELYGDFSQPAKPGLALPIWDFVALVGESLVGQHLRDDPLWVLFAELAARDPGEAPGRHFSPPPAWRVPERWLTPFAATEAWQWSGRRRRLQVRHPAGFVVLDVPAPGRDYISVLTAELAPYRAAGLCGGVVHRAPPETAGQSRDLQIRSPVLRRWCGWLLPYIRARLQRALGVGTADEVGARLCTCPARLRITATHLDAHFALADLPIAVRLAGLDRDPGWVPAAGRYIRFHFD